ncbi:MAG: ABC transporter ATP-binding protein [Clostridia bacterium]|nr:ABC transporter ATP-binding protein [Clostridia bacterium]MDR3645796.1 ABC transporter ATP-binding protein [Clostridia bacterium]
MDIVEVRDLTYKYPTSSDQVLRGVSLRVKKGEFCSIIGPNGAGKTTLCNAIRGLVPHFYKGDMQGEVLINGQSTMDVSLADLALSVGFVFQNPFTQISGIAKTVFGELAFGLENLGVEPDEIRRRVSRMLEVAKLQDLAERSPFEISGGQQQRVALASIIIMEPEILVIDEPTSQLDPQSTEEIFEIIQLMKMQGKTIILVEHKIDLVAQYSDHVVLIEDGSIVMDGSTDEILSDPAVLQHGTSLPQFALLGIEMRKRGYRLDKIPITEAQAVEQIGGYFTEKAVD